MASTFRLKENAATPSVPLAGELKIYGKTDKKAYVLFDDGNEALLTGTAQITGLSGDVTGTGPGVAVTTIAAGAVDNGKISASAAIAFSKMAALATDVALVTNGSGVVTASSVTSTELGYVSGVTSSIQSQINGKQASDSDLTALAGLGTTGVIVRTGSGTATTRTLTAGTGINITDGDGISGNPTISTPITQYTDEMAQDAVGNILVDSTNIDFTYNDAANSITASVVPNSLVNADVSPSAAIAYSKLALTGAIVDSDIAGAAAIAMSKLAALTASRAVEVNGSGALVASAVTSAELNRLTGVTSDIQTQINGKQAADSDLTALAALSTNGLIAKTGSGTATTRTITSGTGIAVTNGDGVSANPNVAVDFTGFTTDAITEGSTNLYYTTARATSVVSSALAARSINTTAPITGGGDLSADRTIAIPKSTASVDGYLDKTDFTNFQTGYTGVNNATASQTASRIVLRDSNADTSIRRLKDSTGVDVLDVQNRRFTDSNGLYQIDMGTPITAIAAIPDANVIGQIAKSVAGGSAQFLIQNLDGSTGAGSTDYIVNSDLGVDSNNYADFGINVSNFTDASWTINGGGDAYLYNNDGNLALGNNKPGSSVTVFTGGTLAANERMRVADAAITTKIAFVNQVVALTDAATINTDASLGNTFSVTLGGNRTLANPTNPTDGQRIMFRILQDATGSRTLAFGSQFNFGIDLALVSLSSTANATDYIGCIYNSANTKWDVIAISRAY